MCALSFLNKYQNMFLHFNILHAHISNHIFVIFVQLAYTTMMMQAKHTKFFFLKYVFYIYGEREREKKK